MISKIRTILPRSCRLNLKEMTGKHPILTFFIALFYGFLLNPYRTPWIRKKGIPKMFVNPDIYAIDCAVDMFVERVYERYYELQKGDVAIDVGANIGMFTVKASMTVGGQKGNVIAIEPVQQNFELLKKNVDFTNCKMSQ